MNRVPLTAAATPLAAPAAPTRAERRQGAAAAAPVVHLHVGRVTVDGGFAAAAALGSAGLADALQLALAQGLAASPAEGQPALLRDASPVQGLAQALLPHLRRGLAQGEAP